MKILRMIWLSMALCLNGLALFAVQVGRDKGFTIEGRVDGLKQGMQVCLLLGKDTVSKTLADQQGGFRFEGHVDGEINLYTLELDKQLTSAAQSFFLTNEQVKVSAYIEDWPGIKIGGSMVNAEYKQALKDIDYENIRNTFRTKPVVFTTEDWERVKSAYRNSMIVPLIVKELVYYRLVTPAAGMAYLNSLDEGVKGNTFGKEIADWLDKVEKSLAAEEAVKNATKGIQAGGSLSDFEIADQGGKKISVLELVRKNKLTLIDFWASWCPPCRAETPNMKRVYEAFKEKGFNIIGISSDAKTEDWKKAIRQDQTTWVHGINQQKVAYEKFGIEGIPAFILVDAEGKLIAFQASSLVKSFGPPIRGEELFKTIGELLK